MVGANKLGDHEFPDIFNSSNLEMLVESTGSEIKPLPRLVKPK